MDPLARQYLSDLYTNKLTYHGDHPEAVSWSRKGQTARFEAMYELASPLEGKNLLDYGCGKADFYGFIKSKGIKARYTGLDITPGLLELAAAKHPECSFYLHDIEETPLEERFDIAFVCGVFNTRIEGATLSMKNSMRLLFEQTDQALIVNALSSMTREKSFELNYVDPDELLSYTRKNITGNAELRQDLVDGDIFLRLNH